MAREYDRPATIAALVNAAVVYLLPLAFIAVIAMLTDPHRLGSSVTAHGPDYLSNVAKATVAYVTGVAPFAMAAAWRTFVHAKRWLAFRDRAWWGVLEAGACGFAGAVLVLLPGLATHTPQQSIPYVIAYGIPTLLVGLGVGVVLTLTGLAALTLWLRRRPAIPAGDFPAARSTDTA